MQPIFIMIRLFEIPELYRCVFGIERLKLVKEPLQIETHPKIKYEVWRFIEINLLHKCNVTMLSLRLNDKNLNSKPF